VAWGYQKLKELTAAGTVQVFHLIPYYEILRKQNLLTLSATNILIFYNIKFFYLPHPILYKFYSSEEKT
jgi:hypothetical protein